MLSLCTIAISDARAGIGRMSVESVSPSGCASMYPPVFAKDESIRMQGTGFAAGSPVELEFDGAGYSAALGFANADSDGALDATVVVPGPPGLQGEFVILGQMLAWGSTPTGEPHRIDAGMQIKATSGDGDNDQVPDYCDNCPAIANEDQADADYDLIGDACDPCPLDRGQDLDGDGICAPADTCPEDPDNDVDGDSICGNVDNCPDTPNSNQLDSDGNGVGDACQEFPTCSDGVDNDRDGQVDYPEEWMLWCHRWK